MKISQLLTLLSLLAVTVGGAALGVFIFGHSIDRSFDYTDIEYRKSIMSDPNAGNYNDWLTYEDLSVLPPNVAEQYRDAVNAGCQFAYRERVEMMWIIEIAALAFFVGVFGSICFGISLRKNRTSGSIETGQSAADHPAR